MAFKLPKYTELTNDQKIIAGLGFDKNILVSAAPGTGKTVIAIYRAHELSDAGKKVAMLVYKRTLMEYLSSTVRSLGIKAVVNTWHSWLVEFYAKKLNNKNGYRLASDEPYSYNWTRIKMDFERYGSRHSYGVYDTVILDEAQDIPIELIEALKYISKSITCLMDPQQSIEVGGSNHVDVAIALGVRKEYTLDENFRNHKEVYDLSQVYRQASVNPREPIFEKPHFVKHTGVGIPFEKIKDVIRRRKLPYIGVFVTNKQLEKTYEELNSAFPGKVYMYKTRSRYNTISFDQEGIYVLSYNTMKGLEFDEVIMPRFDKVDSSCDADTDTNLIYVAISRASHYFYGIYQGMDHHDGYIDVMRPFREGKADKDIVRWE